jgi:RimJ/RimL family protein N-acetyltransferase
VSKLIIGREVVRWVARNTNEFGDFGCATGIGMERDGRIIAGVAYAEWNGVNVVCHIASDGSRRWMTKRYLWTIFDYPFNQLKVGRITVCVGEGNAASRGLVEHMGFTEEARLKDAHPTGDLLIYSMRKPHCRWLTMRLSNGPARTNLLRAAA